jgi:hypothetical protein
MVRQYQDVANIELGQQEDLFGYGVTAKRALMNINMGTIGKSHEPNTI